MMGSLYRCPLLAKVFQIPLPRQNATQASLKGDSRFNLLWLAETHKHVLQHVAQYLVDESLHTYGSCCLACSGMESAMAGFADKLWEARFFQCWPAVYGCLKFHGATDWFSLLKEMKAGRLTCVLEIFHRRKKTGFEMSYMPGEVRYGRESGCYIVRYISAREVPLETIPLSEDPRLRLSPGNACGLFPSERGTAVVLENAACGKHHFNVWKGIDPELSMGHGVELQWKMHIDSPFGWWYAELERLTPLRCGTQTDDACEAERLGRPCTDKLAVATLVFPQFAPNSKWYRMEVMFGDGKQRDSSLAGVTGGIRAVPAGEAAWDSQLAQVRHMFR